MNQIVQEVLTILNAIAAPVIALAGVWLGWRLSAASQRIQRQLDLLHDRFGALAEILKVIDNVSPDLGREALARKLAEDEEFRNSLGHRLVRLFGLRTGGRKGDILNF